MGVMRWGSDEGGGVMIMSAEGRGMMRTGRVMKGWKRWRG